MNWQAGSLIDDYTSVRGQTLAICEPLENEDFQVQPMDDASPPKWHLAHVTWFFETFLLKPNITNYRPYNDAFEVLFNSYYNGVGEQFPRPKRGHLSRPTMADVMDYRRYVDEQMAELLHGDISDELTFRTRLGLHHEQQHQELLFTDLKYNLGNNPLYPPYRAEADTSEGNAPALHFVEVEGGIHEIGVDPSPDPACFSFDNESPRHRVLTEDFAVASRLVTNGEYLAFIEDNGYRRPELWLSDAWTAINDPATGFDAPLYWVRQGDEWYEYTLHGLRPLCLEAPVCHVSGYEADAYARWSGHRLPTEPEWEVMAQNRATTNGNFVERGNLHPTVADGDGDVMQVFGDVWEWTQSSYAPYPGFKPFRGALGEYNGKFMSNQLVLRGGSCVTPASHIRPTYRNFFYPGDRWQFSGIRLARE